MVSDNTSLHSQIMKNLYLNAERDFVIFNVFDDNKNEPERIPGHTLILAAGSKVFHDLFYGNPKREAEIEIKNSSVAAFKLFMKFFYMDHEDISYDDWIEVLKLANKFDVPQCFDAISLFMERNFNLNTVCFAFTMAITYRLNMPDLYKLCDQFIATNYAAIFKLDSFYIFPDYILENFLQIIKNTNPMTIFNACMKWASYKCGQKNIDKVAQNLRHQLGNCFRYILFEKMSLSEFAECLTKYKGLFESSEMERIIIKIAEARKRRYSRMTKLRKNKTPK